MSNNTTTDMENIFDKVGKRTPYRVPDGFFQDMEEAIKDRTVRKSSTGFFSSNGWRAMAAAVAALVVGLVALSLLDRAPESSPMALADSLGHSESVLMAQGGEAETDEVGDEQYLSDEDLEVMIAFYECDPFMEYDY